MLTDCISPVQHNMRFSDSDSLQVRFWGAGRDDGASLRSLDPVRILKVVADGQRGLIQACSTGTGAYVVCAA